MTELHAAPSSAAPAEPQSPPSFPFPVDPHVGIPAEYAERRASCPFGKVRLPSGDEAVLLVTYADSAAALADTRLSHNLTAPGSPRITAGPSFFDDPENLLNKEGADHLRIRRIVASAFTPRRIERWKPTIAAVAGELIDAMESAGSPADLVSDYCFQLPVRIICKLLGVPERDRGSFRDWSNAFVSAARMEPQQRAGLMHEFSAYTAALLAAKRAEPGDDLIDDLIAARDGADRLTESELVYLVAGLIAAGNETTSNMLSRSVLTLLRDGGGLWKQLVGDPDLIPAAVDELLRYNPLGNGAALRLAVEDVELPSGTVRAGDAVLIAASAALRDEAVYPDPDAVRFDREAPAQIVFGAGPHYCLGAHLAKAELRIGLGLLVERLPGLRLAADPLTLSYTEGEVLSSLVSLPVAW
ncbi:MAG TPA: cytochrome P450 [Actinocrinis sp.]|uniref:cytochrome P450 n=1 Tax=Actinocrinis sp. TaxID=1920516 RepID=UPI002D3C18BB|nr:cytochrome P450 [Actinocrinis sp.]HZU54943.1 cytochrome P450 [Actinocrinis sp.]